MQKGMTLYFDCFSGASGDMILGALLDLGVSEEVFLAELSKLGLDGYQIEISRKQKNGITGTDVHVVLEEMEGPEGHSHTDCLHNHPHGQERETHIPDVHGHAGHCHADVMHHSNDETGSHGHSHVHRSLRDILELIDKSTLDHEVKALSSRVFTRLAIAEGKVHNAAPEDVHFHEVGAVDSIVDIVGACILLNELGCETCVCSSLSEGRGFVHCQHGQIPVPVPAVVEVLAQSALTLQLTDTVGEMVTPTGAAILAEVCAPVPQAEMQVRKIGYGMGKKDFAHPNVLRVMLVEKCGRKGESREALVELQTNLDDITPETMGFVLERLLDAGALDAFCTSAMMKKGRPAVVLHVLCRVEQAEQFEGILFKETHTLGVRRLDVSRACLPREIQAVDTEFGVVRLKHALYNDEEFIKPEYEDVKRIAQERGLSLLQVKERVLAAYRANGDL